MKERIEYLSLPPGRRIICISDIHGNAPALRLAMADARAQGAQAFLFAGDYCVSAPWAEDAVNIMRGTENALSGNET